MFRLLTTDFGAVASDPGIPIEEGTEDARAALHTANIDAIPGLPVVLNLTQEPFPAASKSVGGCR